MLILFEERTYICYREIHFDRNMARINSRVFFQGNSVVESPCTTPPFVIIRVTVIVHFELIISMETVVHTR